MLQVGSLGGTAKRVRLEASSDECVALANRFELCSIDSIVAELIIERIKGGEMIRVLGRMCAKISQVCVVSGETVVATIEENVDERFGPPDETDAEVDLGETIAQYLGVAIDPYPRVLGAEIPQQYQVEEGPVAKMRRNPFEVLASVQNEGD